MNHVTNRLHIVLVLAAVLTLVFTTSPASSQVYMVKDINPGAGGTYIFRAGSLGEAIYFNAFDGTHGEELWVSNGNPGGIDGTYLVKDIWPDTTYDSSEAYSSNSDQFIATTAGVFFVAAHREDPATAPDHDVHLWISTGHSGNGSIVPGFQMALSGSASDAVVMGDLLYIAGWDEANGIELWKTNGSSASRVTQIEPGVGGSDPTYLTVVGDQLFFSGTNSATSGIELWVTGGTLGTESLIDIVPGKQVLVVIGGEEPFPFGQQQAWSIGFKVCHRNDPGVYFFKLVLIDEVQ